MIGAIMPEMPQAPGSVWSFYIGVDDIEVTTYAGHNPPILVQQGQAAYLKMASGLMLGAMEGVEYQAGSFTLAPEDMVFL